jgi:glycosyltransferase involved in cell wall biosynthesis
MRIAMVSTVFKETPPNGYGGIERIVYTLTEELIRQGHDVTLFAVGRSHCSGKTILIPGYDPSKAPSGVRGESDALTEEPLYRVMKAYFEGNKIDVIHDWSFENRFVLRHPDALPYVITTAIPPVPNYNRPNLVGVSKAHAAIFGERTKYVYYGLDLDKFKFSNIKKDHFVHIAKIARYKAQHLAIKACRSAGKRLILAGPVEGKRYYYLCVKPYLLAYRGISYIGEIKNANDYLIDAAALIQTPRWFDAFPIAILEAFASGTPVISLSEGGVPEQIVNGVNGFLCRDVDDMIAAISNISAISPQDCRAYAEEHFTAERMAREYTEIYQRVIDGERW